MMTQISDDRRQVQLSALPTTPLDPNSGVPLYRQIESDLRRLIRNGQIPPESSLPTEMALCEAYKVGRHTMRMALSQLVADELISRRAGSGTIVMPQPDRTKFLLDRSFTQAMAEMGRVARTEVLDIVPGLIDDGSPIFFAEKQGAPCFQLNRLRYGDDVPIGLQYSTILLEDCPGLEDQNFDQFGLYDILAREYNLRIAQIRHTITASSADAFQAHALHIDVGAPLLVVNTATYLDNDGRFEYTISFYRSDLYEYSTVHTFES